MEYSMLPKLEAVLFMSGNPLPLERLSEVLEEEKEMILGGNAARLLGL